MIERAMARRRFDFGFADLIYPSKVLLTLRVASDVFMGQCPKADNVWLHAMAVRSGYRGKQINAKT